MVRQAREESATGYYHVMMRGNNREFIYRTTKDKHYFLQLLKEAENIHLAGYCLMDNHAHLVIKAQLEQLTKAAQKINIKYAMHYNFHNRRVGHVFQNRYRSEVVNTEPYLMQVLRYIHNNPLRAGVIKKAEDYRWSSYKEYLDKCVIVANDQKTFIMNLFSDSIAQFTHFHQLKDNHEYLDTKEEIDQNRTYLAQSLITDFLQKKGIFEEKQIRNNDDLMEGLILKLLDETKLSHREIAQLLKINRNQIHKIACIKNKG